MKTNVELNYKQIKELRKALGQQVCAIDCVNEYERYEVIGDLYDLFLDLEEFLKPEEEE